MAPFFMNGVQLPQGYSHLRRQFTFYHSVPRNSIRTGFFLNQNSLHARLNNHYKAWSYKKKSTKRLQHTENLFRKNLPLKDVF